MNADRKDEDQQTLSKLAPLQQSWGGVLLAKQKEKTRHLEDELDEEELPSAWPKKLNSGDLPTVHNNNEEGRLTKLMEDYNETPSVQLFEVESINDYI